jgi:hypothetical protein
MRFDLLLPFLLTAALACGGDDDGSIDAAPDEIDSGTGDDDGGDDGDDDGGDLDGGPVRLCGGFAGLRCDEGDYCDFPDDTCGAADALGSCLPRPDECEPREDPVCACNAMAYDSPCLAAMAGEDVSASFECGLATGR